MKLLSYIVILSFCATILCSSSLAETRAVTPKVTYDITGLPEKILENAQKRLQSSSTQLLDQAEKEIILAIQPFGYFHSKMTYNVSNQKEKRIIHFHVDLGPPLYIIKTEIKIIGPGENDPAIQQALKNTSILKIGKVLTTPAYDRMQTFMFNLAHNNGFASAQMVKHEIYANLEKNEASIFLTLDTGPRYYYGPVSFTPSPYSTDFLNRFVPFKPGQTYSPKTTQKLQEGLSNSKYFSAVAVNPEIDKADDNHQVPIVVETQAVKSQQYNFGVGYGTNTGARTSVGMDFYRLTDTGQSFSTLLNLSTVTTSMTAKYFIPGSDPTISQYVNGFYLGQFNPSSGDSYTKKLFTGYDTKLNTEWSLASYLNYMHERFSIDDAPYLTTNMIYPNVVLSRLSTNNVINPEKGSRVTLDVSAGAPGTTVEFIQSELSGKWIYPASKNNFIILRGDIGAIYANDYNTVFPFSMRFFSGGYNSVRGYSYQSLGPGKYLKVASAEIDQRIIDKFYVGVFLDEGNASDNFNQPLERGIGIDLIYRTSVGPLSIDIAQANTQPDKPLSIEFNFGANL